jgi:signal peptidase I
VIATGRHTERNFRRLVYWIRWAKALALSVICVATMLMCGCKKQTVASPSMWPTIKPGESVTIDYSAYSVAKPKRWDVVVFHGPTQFLRTNMTSVKRVIALPTETISLTSTGILVNGTQLTMPAFLSNVVYCPPDKTPQKQDFITFPYTVPARHYFVVGDNWANSLDSRYYGGICITDIVGQVLNK